MAQNLATKYKKQLAKMLEHKSYVDGNTAKDAYDFNEAGEVIVKTVLPSSLNDYNMKTTGLTSRYGEMTEVDDVEFKLKLTVDKSFTKSVDKRYQKQQQIENIAGKFVQVQTKQVLVPFKDRLYFSKVSSGGKIFKGDALTATNLVSAVTSAREFFVDNAVPTSDRFLYLKSDLYSLLLNKTVSEFTSLEKMATKALCEGHVGDMLGFHVVEVPKDYFTSNTKLSISLPTGLQFLCVQKEATIAPGFINELDISDGKPFISGKIITGRLMCDAIVRPHMHNAVYAYVTGTQLATPSLGGTASAQTLTCSGAKKILYTLDGSDPRDSAHVETYTAAFDTDVDGFVEIRAIGIDNTFVKWNSDILVSDPTPAT